MYSHVFTCIHMYSHAVTRNSHVFTRNSYLGMYSHVTHKFFLAHLPPLNAPNSFFRAYLFIASSLWWICTFTPLRKKVGSLIFSAKHPQHLSSTPMYIPCALKMGNLMLSNLALTTELRWPNVHLSLSIIPMYVGRYFRFWTFFRVCRKSLNVAAHWHT
jgi:hypothetical protein